MFQHATVVELPKTCKAHFYLVYIASYGFCNITDGALSSISEGVTRLARAGRTTCKVRCDFKIITDK